MSSKKTIIHSKSKDNTTLSECNIQIVPCKIDFNGKTSIDKHLNNYIMKEENDILSTSFRGYPLRGKQIQLGEDITGVVFERSLDESNNEVHLHPIKIFKEFKYWNWGKDPNHNDDIQKALEYFEISEALHKPITE
ncbi:uncharacterized protein LOC123297694 [Chrysoperla carnea]|uniref:uncharacterized protein LOC123297694 n=1 Tax=Chrysoperla carnea TaxID=189513 RepID=UPI001D07055A|nr:uncharacterized protein LOC123297694 [Chrysoperla carnea]